MTFLHTTGMTHLRIAHLMFNNFFFFENRALYDMMMENIVQPDTPQMTIRRMRIAFRTLTAINTHSEYEKILLFHCNNGCKNVPQYYVITHVRCLV